MDEVQDLNTMFEVTRKKCLALMIAKIGRQRAYDLVHLWERAAVRLLFHKRSLGQFPLPKGKFSGQQASEFVGGGGDG